MKKDGRQREPSEQSSGNSAVQSRPRPAPGKVTPTSKLPSQRAVQRKLDAPTENTGSRTRSLAEWTDDPLMDLAHRGITDSSTLPVDGGQQVPAGEPETLAGAGPALAGTIPLITGPGLNKSKGDTASNLAGETSQDTGTPASTGVPVLLDLDLSFDNSRGTGTGATPKLDPGQGNFNLSFSQPGGRGVSPFGEEFYEPAFANTAWRLQGGVCKINANLQINCPWGTSGGGRIDVPSGTDGVVTRGNWQQIRDDLKPSGASPHKSARTQYYSQALVERHEKFHGTDDWGWSRGSGVALVNAKCAATNIRTASANADVTSLLEACRQLLLQENFKWYMGAGASHDAYAGEIRAYADGKPRYEALATAVENHGRTL